MSPTPCGNWILSSNTESAASPRSRFQTGFSTLGCAELDLGQIMQLAVEHAVGAVELRVVAGRLDPVAALKERFGTPAGAAVWWRDQPACVRILTLQTSFKLAGSTAADREVLLETAPWADALGARWLRVFDGCAGTDAGGNLSEMAGTIIWWREQRRSHRWRTDLAIETHDSLLTTADVAPLTDRFPDIAILWDPHNMWKKGGEEPVAVWRAIRRQVAYVHVKDSIAQPSPRHQFTYVLPGRGEFPMGALRAALVADGFAGVLSLEWERHWHPYLPPLPEALQAMRASGWW